MPGDDFWFASTKDRLEDMSFNIPDTLDPIRNRANRCSQGFEYTSRLEIRKWTFFLHILIVLPVLFSNNSRHMLTCAALVCFQLTIVSSLTGIQLKFLQKLKKCLTKCSENSLKLGVACTSRNILLMPKMLRDWWCSVKKETSKAYKISFQTKHVILKTKLWNISDIK